MALRDEASQVLASADHVSKLYVHNGLPVHALRDVSLAVVKGEFMALAGPSGSGKTSLLNLLGALDRSTSGEVYIGGQAVSETSATALSQLRLNSIGFIFQDYNLLPVLSALENVEYVLLLQGVNAPERRRRADEALRQLGLDGMQHRRPAQLSGGQQQRVAIARAIAAKPALVLADEPTANLDSETGEALIETMLQLNRELGTTFVFSTHDERVMRHASRVVHLRDGQIVEERANALR